MIFQVLRRAQPLAGTRPGSTWILLYHLVDGGTGLGYDISQELFGEHLDMLKEQADVISMQTLARDLRAGRARSTRTGDAADAGADDTAAAGAGSAPDDAGADAAATRADATGALRPRVVITFDDAFVNFYDKALPLLAERSLPSIMYVPPSFVNGDGIHPMYEPRFAHLGPMTWEQLADSTSAGVEIGSHTYQHREMTSLDPSELLDAFQRANDQLEDKLGIRPPAVSYPEGFVNPRVIRAAARFHETGVIGGGLAIDFGSAEQPPTHEYMLQLPRLPLKDDMSAELLSRYLQAGVCLEEIANDNLRRVKAKVAKFRRSRK